MKAKVSVSLEEETLVRVRKKLREGLFRNKSHLIEYAVNSFLKDKEVEDGLRS